MTNRWLTGWLQAEPWLRVLSFTLLALLLLLLLACGSHARDPFFLQESRCQPATADAAAGWRLLGIIGHPGHYHAWLRSPQGSTLHGQTRPDRRRAASDRVADCRYRLAERLAFPLRGLPARHKADVKRTTICTGCSVSG